MSRKVISNCLSRRWPTFMMDQLIQNALGNYFKIRQEYWCRWWRTVGPAFVDVSGGSVLLNRDYTQQIRRRKFMSHGLPEVAGEWETHFLPLVTQLICPLPISISRLRGAVAYQNCAAKIVTRECCANTHTKLSNHLVTVAFLVTGYLLSPISFGFLFHWKVLAILLCNKLFRKSELSP